MAETERNGILATDNWIIDHIKIIDIYPAQDALTNVGSETINPNYALETVNTCNLL